MAVGGDWRSVPNSESPRNNTGGGTRSCGVERAKVHEKGLCFQSPTGNEQLSLRAEAHHPTDVNVRTTAGLELQLYCEAQQQQDCPLWIKSGPHGLTHHLPC